MVLERFEKSLAGGQALVSLRAGQIGEGVLVDGPEGPKPLTFADHASGARPLRQVEDFVTEHLLPFLGAGDTPNGYSGRFTAELRAEARALVARHAGAGASARVIFTDGGADGAVRRFIQLAGLQDLGHVAHSKGAMSRALGRGPQPPLVLVVPKTAPARRAPWLECGAEVWELPAARDGGPDLTALEAVLRSERERRPLILGAFAAVSPVSGQSVDVVTVTSLLKSYRALACWDYALAGHSDSLKMDLAPGCGIDAMFLAPHLFPGGAGASGVLVIRESAVLVPGPVAESTPSVLADARAALAFQVKAAVGVARITQRYRQIAATVHARVEGWPNVTLEGVRNANRLPIFGLTIHDAEGQPVPCATITRLLSDGYGIQAGECCMGEGAGQTRLSLSYLIDDGTLARILAALDEIAADMARDAQGELTDEDEARHVDIAPPMAASA